MAVDEGEIFQIDHAFDATSFNGALEAEIDWGDGSESTIELISLQGQGPLSVRFDYTYDSEGFFTPDRREILQQAGDSIISHFDDHLDAITPRFSNTWTAIFDHPSDRTVQVELPNMHVPENEVVIFAGAQSLDPQQLAEGSFGGFTASGTSSSFLNAVAHRGQHQASNAIPTDFGPWGGAISFNEDTNWFFGEDPESISPTQTDFWSVATHEIAHVLGFGSAESWHVLAQNDVFIGENAVAQYDGPGSVPLEGGHWASGILDEGSPTLLDPEIAKGQRYYPTPLDLAALDDIGWSLADRTIHVSDSHVYADDGVYQVTITINGSEFGIDSITDSVRVDNVRPIVSVPEFVDAVVGELLVIEDLAVLVDPGFDNDLVGSQETFTYEIDWGDGSPRETGPVVIDEDGTPGSPTVGSFDQQHVYHDPGIYDVRVVVEDDDRGRTTKFFEVGVFEPPQLVLALASSVIVENEGFEATELIVSRSSSDLDHPLVVQIANSHTSEVNLSSVVTIPSGSESVVLPIDAIDDQLLDGDHNITISVTAPGFVPDSASLLSLDHEVLTASFLESEVSEASAATDIPIRLMRSNIDTSEPLLVTASGSTDRIVVPPTVVIPAGQQSVDVISTLVDDANAQGPQAVFIDFFADGYDLGTASITILDDEPAFFQNPFLQYDVDGNEIVTPLDALLIINELNRSGTRPLDPLNEDFVRFFDTNADYLLSPLDALIVINHLNESASTLPTSSRGLHHLAFSDDEDWLLDLRGRLSL